MDHSTPVHILFLVMKETSSLYLKVVNNFNLLKKSRKSERKKMRNNRKHVNFTINDLKQNIRSNKLKASLKRNT